jgi:hypothetical protein
MTTVDVSEAAAGAMLAAPPPDTAPALAHALWYATVLGWPVFPCHTMRDSVCSCGGGCDSPGKHPMTASGFRNASVDEDVIREWWTHWPDANIGTPYPAVLDCDLPRDSDPADGVAEYRKLEKKYGIVAGVAIAKSGGGGFHVYFGPGAAAGKAGPGLSLRGEGNYAILPPSLHKSGRCYRWERPPIAARPLPLVPDWLKTKQTAATKKLKTKVFTTDEKIAVNERHDAIAAYIGGLRRRNPQLLEEEALVLAHAFRLERCEQPEEKVSDVDELVAYVYEKEPPEGDAPYAGDVPDGAELLDEIEEYLRRYMRMSDAEFSVVALYVIVTFGFELFEVLAYLRVMSATKRSGKSRLLDILEMLVRAPLPSGGMSEASLFRSLAERPRTLLFDEIGKVLGEAQRDKNSDLARVFLNGYTVGKPVQRCVGEGTNQTVVDFEVYGPKILAGTGQLDDQILDRCIPIELRRKKRDETVQRFRRRGSKQECEPLRARIAAWVDAHADALRDARPELPDKLDDRGQDIVEPLLAIADLAGGGWAKKAREAVVELRGGSDELEEDVGVELLADIREAFGEAERLTTEELLTKLTENEERPWAHWSKGSPINAAQLARKLRPFGVRPQQLSAKARGYTRVSFEDAFTRYAPPDVSQPVTPSQTAQPSQEEPFSTRHNAGGNDGSKNGPNPHEYGGRDGVTGPNQKQGDEREETCPNHAGLHAVTARRMGLVYLACGCQQAAR